MMAASKKMLDHEPSEVEMLLPFHAAGTLSARDARRVEDALASDPELARQYAVIREEYAETISLNESLGAPGEPWNAARSRATVAISLPRRRCRSISDPTASPGLPIPKGRDEGNLMFRITKPSRSRYDDDVRRAPFSYNRSHLCVDDRVSCAASSTRTTRQGRCSGRSESE
jgi:hypothetical protein